MYNMNCSQTTPIIENDSSLFKNDQESNSTDAAVMLKPAMASIGTCTQEMGKVNHSSIVAEIENCCLKNIQPENQSDDEIRMMMTYIKLNECDSLFFTMGDAIAKFIINGRSISTPRQLYDLMCMYDDVMIDPYTRHCLHIISDASKFAEKTPDRNEFIRCVMNKKFEFFDDNPMKRMIARAFGVLVSQHFQEIENYYKIYFYAPLLRRIPDGLFLLYTMPPVAQMMSAVKSVRTGMKSVDEAAQMLLDNQQLLTDTITNVKETAENVNSFIDGSAPVLKTTIESVGDTATGVRDAFKKVDAFVDEAKPMIVDGQRLINNLNKTTTRARRVMKRITGDNETTTDGEDDDVKPKNTALLDIITLMFDNAAFLMALNNISDLLHILFKNDVSFVFKVQLIGTFLPRILCGVYKVGEIVYDFFKTIIDYLSKNIAQGPGSIFQTLYQWLTGYIRMPFSYEYVYASITQFNTFQRLSGFFSLKNFLEQLRTFFAYINPFTSLANFLDHHNIEKKTINTFLTKATEFFIRYEFAVERDLNKDPDDPSALDEFLKSDDNFKIATDLMNQKIAIKTSILRIRETDLAAHKGGLKDYFDQISSILDKFHSYRIQRFSRLTPRCIRLTGKTRVGKTTIASIIARHLLKLDDVSKIYTRNANDKYWSGYNVQQAVIYDDFNQSTELKDVNELFDLVTSNKVLPVMADLSNEDVGKKGTPFSSPLVILCSNMTIIGNLDSVVHSPDAFYSRIHDDIEVIKTGEYQDDFSHLTFRFRSNTGYNGEDRPTYDLVELLKILEDRFITHIKKEKKLKTARNDFLDTLTNAYSQHDLEQLLAQGGASAFDDDNYETTNEIDEKQYEAVVLKLAKEATPERYTGLTDIKDDVKRKVKQVRINAAKRLPSGKKADAVIKRVGEAFFGISIRGIGICTGIFLGRLVVQLMRKVIDYMRGKVVDEFDDKVRDFCKENDLCDEFPKILDFLKHQRQGTVINTQSWDASQQFRAKKVVRPDEMKAQGSMDQNAIELINGKLSDHHGLIYLMNSKGLLLGGMSCIAIEKNVFLFPRHLLPAGWKDDEYRIKVMMKPEHNRQACFVRSVTKKCTALVNEDAMLIDFEAGFDYVKSIIKHFIGEGELSIYSNANDRFDGELVLNRSNQMYRIGVSFSPNATGVDYYSRGEQYIMLRGFQYRAMTGEGDCGGVLVRFNDKLASKFIGMHVCGANVSAKGHAILITREQLTRAYQSLSKPVTLVSEAKFFEIACVTKMEGNAEAIGQVEKEYQLFQPDKTELRPSILFGVFDVLKEPAVLSNKDKRLEVKLDKSLLEHRLTKYATPMACFKQQTLDLLEAWCHRFLEDMGPCERYLLDYDLCLNGFDNLSRMNPNTSVGLPHVKNIEKDGKRDFMEFDVDTQKWFFTLKGKVILDEALNYESMAKKKIRDSFVWSALLKDELRTIEKIKKGSTRAFIGCPMAFTLVFRRYFGSFVEFMHKKGPDVGFTTGINPESSDWDDLWRRLLRLVRFLGYDIQDFDSEVIWFLMKCLLNVVNHWYNDGEENGNVREVIMHEVCFTFFTVFNVVYMKRKGVPSGLPATVEFDSWFSLMYMMICFIEIHIEQFNCEPTYEDFRRGVEVAVNGDDNTSSVSVGVSKWFNNVTISRKLSEYGIVVTSAQKGEVTVPYYSIDEVEYLKRKVGRMAGQYVPLMNFDTIRSMVMWVRDDESLFEATMTNLNNAQMFLYFYGKKIFDEFNDVIKAKLINDGYNVILNSWEFFNNRYRKTGKFELSEIMMAQGGDGTVEIGAEALEDCCASEMKPEMNVAVTEKIPQTINIPKPYAIIDEPEINLQRLTAIPVKIAYGNWTTSQAQGTKLLQLQLPYFLTTIPKYSNYLKNFKFVRCTFSFQLELNGTPFHQGKIMISYQPIRTNLDTEVATTTKHHQVANQLISASAYASSNNTCTIDVPWCGEYSYYYYGSNTSSGFQPFATINVIVFTPLNVGTGAATSLNWTLYCTLKNVDAKIYQPQNSAQFLDFTMISNSLTNARDNALPMSFAGDELDTNMSIPFPMDCVANTLAPMHMVRRVTTNYNNCDGIFPHNRFDLHPCSLAVTREDDFGFDYDEMDIAFFKKRWSFVNAVTITAAETNGTLLFKDALSPLDAIMNPYSGMTTPGNKTGSSVVAASSWAQQITLPGLIALLCKSWKGSLEYCFEFISTQYHTMKIFVSWQYGIVGSNAMPSTITTSTIDPLSASGELFEVNQGRNIFTVKIPYVHVVEWCNTMARNAYTGNSNYGSQAWAIGTMAVYVVNPLVYPAGVPNTVVMNVFKKIGDDFEMGNYMPAYSGLNVLAQLRSTSYIFKVNSIRDMIKRKCNWGMIQTTSTERTVCFDPLLELSHCYPMIFSCYRSCKGSIRASFILDSALSPGQNVYIMWVPYQMGEDSHQATTTGLTLSYQIWDLINSMFLAPQVVVQDVTTTAINNLYGKNQEVRMVTRGNVSNGAGGTITQTGGSSTISANNISQLVSPICTEILSSQSMSCDIEIPYCCNLPITPMNSGVGTFATNQYGTIVVFSYTACNVRVFLGAGDDFRLGQFMGTPSVCLAAYGLQATGGNTGGYGIGYTGQDV